MSKVSPRYTGTNARPVDLEELPIEDLSVLEVLYEQSEKAHSEGRDTLTVTQAQVDAKIREKKEERKKTGRVSTIIPPGAFATVDVIVETGDQMH